MTVGRRRLAALVAGLAVIAVFATAPPNPWFLAGAPTTTPAVVAAAAASTDVSPAEAPGAAAAEASPQPGGSDARIGAATPRSAPPSPARFHVPILMYHLVGDADDPSALPALVVSARLFAAQLATLQAHGWRTLSLTTLAADLLADRPPPPKSFVITFDDGHADGYTVALPILRRLGDSATFFVITDRVGRPGYLSAPDLRALVRDGMEIGNHTVSHPDLARLRPARAREQIDRAETALTSIIGSPPVVLAYPSGEADPAVQADVAAAGIQLAVGSQPGVLETVANRFLIPRLRVSPTLSPAALLAEMASARSAQ